MLITRRELRMIHSVIDERAVRPVFQPIVHPATGDLVGLEALIRGPENTPLESPQALLQAGAAVGRLGELDWVCRAVAVQTAIDADLPTNLALFLKTDSRTLFEPCPTDLHSIVLVGAHSYRCIVSIALSDSLNLAGVAADSFERFRSLGFEIAVDGQGHRPPGRAVMRRVQPDFVKVDVHCLQELVADRGPRSLSALRDWREGEARHLIVKNVETQADAELATAAGADLAQGWYYGHPAPIDATRLAA